MESAMQPKIMFHGITIVHVNINAQKPPQEGENIELDLDARLFPLEEGNRQFRIWMELEIQVPDYWLLKVAGFGVFELGEEVHPDEMRGLININAPAIMFPYFRAFVSTLAANCGGSLPLLILPPRMFEGELEELKIDEVSSEQ